MYLFFNIEKTKKYTIIYYMEITIHTMYGTFIVPREKIQSLVQWLQQNAVSVNSQQQEAKNNPKTSQLLNG